LNLIDDHPIWFFAGLYQTKDFLSQDIRASPVFKILLKEKSCVIPGAIIGADTYIENIRYYRSMVNFYIDRSF
jgi:hypothetical protein